MGPGFVLRSLFDGEAEHRFRSEEVWIGRGVDQALAGASPGAGFLDVPRPFRSVSRGHARIFRSGPGWTIEGLGKHGTFVDGARLEAPRALQGGETIQLGPEGPAYRFQPTAEEAGGAGPYVLCPACRVVLRESAVHDCPSQKPAVERAKELSADFVQSLVRFELEGRFLALYVLVGLLLLGVPAYIVIDQQLSRRSIRELYGATQEQIARVEKSLAEKQESLRGDFVTTAAKFEELRGRFDTTVLLDPETYADRVYRVVVPGGHASAFAINKTVLATNVHVTRSLPQQPDWELVRGDGARRIPGAWVKRIVEHEGFSPATLDFDVALMILDQPALDTSLRIGKPGPEGDPACIRIKRSAPVWIYGFPGVFEQPRTVAILAGGTIGAVEAHGFWHVSATYPGNSGSPVLDAKGRVLGVHSSGRKARVISDDGSVSVHQLTHVKYAIHVSALRALLQKEGIPFDE